MNIQKKKEEFWKQAKESGIKITAKQYDFYTSFVEEALKEQEKKILKQVKHAIAQLDWIEILSEAIKARPASWGKDVVREWRNASDEVWGAMNNQAVKRGIYPDFLQSLKQNTKKAC